VSKGIYTLLIKLDKPRTITIGKLGRVCFSAGYYVYVGSALNGLESRIARHLKKKKALHWHIDYFLQKARVEEIIYSLTEKNKECTIASQLAQKLISIPHFGSSDCQCASHLYFCKYKHGFKNTISNSFKESGLAHEGMTVEGFKTNTGNFLAN
jgi:sugar fermentation stimulation protein A